ncbi:SusE domain-containing protein [Hymenobacter ruricola]|uniref:SusE domain-containing protein n=1 Tax=Hymenobacter ruricola TaxID=2791023 RepID=A0ABS0I638_9BACT|nr:SusE domain-containing protein [Hymenobacter ruricola]MBF9222349.1 SusE domain-containing protein [Hymenobacter ruricola]
MKNWLTQAAAALFAVAALASCEKDEVKATLTPSNAPMLSASTSAVVLTQPNSGQPAVTFTWTPVKSLAWSNTNSSYAPSVTYQLQVSTPEGGFAGPASIPAGAGPTTVVTVEALNAALTSLALAPGVATKVQVRLAAVVGADKQAFHSAPVDLTVTPYKVCIAPNSDTWSIIGPAGVDWNTDVPLTYDCDTRTYKVTRTLNAGEFKFRKNNDWGVNYGSNVPRSGSGSAALASGGNNIAVPTTGTYTISLDLNALTYTLTQ